MKYFSARRITDFDQFVKEGAKIYHSFFCRTRYFYKKERLGEKGFAAWARPLFEHKKVVVTGAYQAGRLAAVEVSYRVEDVIIEDVYFSDTESQVHQVTEFMTHTIREAAAETDASFIFRGYPSGKLSLDESKLLKGCKVMKLPALQDEPAAALPGEELFEGELPEVFSHNHAVRNTIRQSQLLR